MDRELNQINVIPLVDVMLVLLVIVLTTATFITTGQIPVDLAKAKESGDKQDVPLIVTLTADGRLYLNGQPVQEEGGGTQDCDECSSPGIAGGRTGRSRDHPGQVRDRGG